ncbi:MAG: oxidoreductase, partial [Nocardioides sp.]|nr:oxidoreductase [Nocardioides sp.]
MSGAPAGPWTTGRLVELDRPSDRLVRLRFDVESRVDHLSGQHYVLRLRAADGYTAQRSYSIASEPADPLLELMVECLPGGEVSGFMHDVAEPG